MALMFALLFVDRDLIHASVLGCALLQAKEVAEDRKRVDEMRRSVQSNEYERVRAKYNELKEHTGILNDEVCRPERLSRACRGFAIT